MRKAALFAAAALAAALFTTPSVAASKPDPAIAAQKNFSDLMRDSLDPYGASTRAAANSKAGKVAAKSGKKAKKSGKKAKKAKKAGKKMKKSAKR